MPFKAEEAMMSKNLDKPLGAITDRWGEFISIHRDNQSQRQGMCPMSHACYFKVCFSEVRRELWSS